MRRMAICLALDASPCQADPFDKLLGVDWSHELPLGGTCKSPHRWLLSNDHKQLVVTLEEPVKSRDQFGDRFTYTVLGESGDSITMFLDHETWRDDEGSLVHWILVLEGSDKYFWVRSDWAKGKRTAPVYRCPLVS